MTVLAGTAISSLTSCKKEGALEPAHGTTTELNVTPRVKAFIENVHHDGTLRNAGAMALDSAEWYVEAALNYTCTNAAQLYNDQLVDTFSISIPLLDGEVSAAQAGNAYLTLAELIDAHNVSGSSHVALVDVVTNNAGASLEISAVCVVGSGYTKGAPNTNYGPNDHWLWMGDYSHCGCGPNSGAYGQCADKQIQGRVNYGINGGYYTYWTDVESWWVNHWGEDDPGDKIVGLLSHPSPIGPTNLVSGDGVRDYPVYFSEGGGCFGPTDMKHYTQGAYDLMLVVRNAYVPTKELVSCTVVGEMAMGGGNDQWHWVTYRYGKRAKYDQ